MAAGPALLRPRRSARASCERSNQRGGDGLRHDRAGPVTKTRSDGACGGDQWVIDWNKSLLPNRLEEIDVGEDVVLAYNHPVPLAAREEGHGVESEVGRENAICRDRRTAALGVAEHRGARLDPGEIRDFGGHEIADPTETHRVWACRVVATDHLLSILQTRAFGDHDDREARSAHALLNISGDHPEIEGDLRKKNDV